MFSMSGASSRDRTLDVGLAAELRIGTDEVCSWAFTELPWPRQIMSTLILLRKIDIA